jgi:PAS domain-containing protein
MSSQKEIELILARQLASYLVMPIFIVDPQGNLIYYNEPAEVILGRRFEEPGAMPAGVWSTLFRPEDEAGNPLAAESLPLVAALANHAPAHRNMWIHGLDGIRRLIEVTAFPLHGQAERQLGAMAIFWEIKT